MPSRRNLALRKRAVGGRSAAGAAATIAGRPVEVGGERLHARLAEGHPPLFRALSPHRHGAPTDVQVAKVEAARFGDAQPAAVQQLQQRVVASLQGAL